MKNAKNRDNTFVAVQYFAALSKKKLAAVQQDGEVLQLAPDELRIDKEIVLVAVWSSSDALECVSDELKSDKEVVLVAIQNP